MSEASTSSSRATRSFKSILVWALVLGLLAAVAYLLCERNARMFGLEQREGELWVMRGRFLPAGLAPYQPDDRVFARAYSPILVAGEPLAGLELPTTFADRDELDRALFRVLDGMIETRLGAEDPERLGEAVKLLRRAELLGGILEEQRLQLKDLQAKVAFFEGRINLGDAVESLKLAVEKLRLAADTANPHAQDAGELYERVKGLSDQLAHVARQPLSSSRRGNADGGQTTPAPASPAVPAASASEPAVSPSSVTESKGEAPAVVSPEAASGAPPEAKSQLPAEAPPAAGQAAQPAVEANQNR